MIETLGVSSKFIRMKKTFLEENEIIEEPSNRKKSKKNSDGRTQLHLDAFFSKKA
jgi:hypothetical protein